MSNLLLSVAFHFTQMNIDDNWSEWLSLSCDDKEYQSFAENIVYSLFPLVWALDHHGGRFRVCGDVTGGVGHVTRCVVRLQEEDLRRPDHHLSLHHFCRLEMDSFGNLMFTFKLGHLMIDKLEKYNLTIVQVPTI